jgi:hypothetical protein
MQDARIRKSEHATSRGKMRRLVMLAALCSPSFAQVVTVPQDTEIRLRLSQNVSSADAHVGDPVSLEVLDDVMVGNMIAIHHGAQAHGVVTMAHEKRRMGRAGAVALRVDYVRAEDNSHIRVTADRKSKGDNAAGLISAGIVGSVIIFPPAAPFFLLKHGKDTDIPAGTPLAVFTVSEVQVNTASAPAAIVVPVKVIAAPAAREHVIEGYTISSGASSSMGDPGSGESLGDAGRAARAKKATEGPQ